VVQKWVRPVKNGVFAGVDAGMPGNDAAAFGALRGDSDNSSVGAVVVGVVVGAAEMGGVGATVGTDVNLGKSDTDPRSELPDDLFRRRSLQNFIEKKFKIEEKIQI